MKTNEEIIRKWCKDHPELPYHEDLIRIARAEDFNREEKEKERLKQYENL